MRNETNEEARDRLVRNEVHYCVSQLISELCKIESLESLELYDVLSKEDWITPAEEASFVYHGASEDYEDECKEFCDVNRIDPYTVEALEHWIVSDYLANRLEENGEMISRDILGLTVWGRTCSGQSISMDGVIGKIAADMEKS